MTIIYSIISYTCDLEYLLNLSEALFFKQGRFSFNFLILLVVLVCSVLNLDPDQLFYLVFKAKFDDGSYASLSYLQIVNKMQDAEVLDIFQVCLDARAEKYTDKTAVAIIFTYHILEPQESRGRTPKLLEKNKKVEVPVYNFGGFNFPKSSDYTT